LKFLPTLPLATDADVHVVWRADVSEALLRKGRGGDGIAAEVAKRAAAAVLERIEVCPPNGLEAVAVPIGAARAWLAEAPLRDIADVESVVADERESEDATSPDSKPAFAWRGDESAVVVADDLRPGMTIVVPTSYGGLADGTWDPASLTAVEDIGDRKQTERELRRLADHDSLTGLLNRRGFME